MFIYPYLAKASLGLSLVFALIHPALAQIVPNGARTVVNPQGNQINITGGTQAGGNLFHSFRDFNVNSAQVANFLSNPQIQNILARVNGGNPSLINGLLQVTGGNSNLFLMNPAGIVFGQGASLNIPASFTATTANQIGFGNNLFNAFGDNNFSALVGNPDSFVFTTTQAGSIVNAGNLAVGSGQNISLIGGNIVNTGNINAGNITLAAVPGTNRVRISQPGHLLSLEIVLPVDSAITPLDLPRLLTGSGLPGISSNGSTVQVAGITVPTGQGVNITSGNLNLVSPLPMGEGSGVRAINVLGDRVALVNANLNASGINGGGTIRVGGEYRGGGVNPFNSRITYVDSRSFLNADALNAGNGGRVIVWGNDITRFYGNISARGGASSGNGGFAEVSGAQNLTFAGNADLSAPRGSFGTLLLDPVNIFINNGADALGGCTLPTVSVGCDPGDITISQTTLQALGAAANVLLEASNNITLGTLTGNTLTFASAPGGSITFRADSDGNGVGNFLMNPGDRIDAPGRNITINAARITAGDIYTSTASAQNGGSINLTATAGNISAGFISSGSGVNTGNAGAGGNINILAPLGNVNISGNVDSRSVTLGNPLAGNSRDAGNITINAQSISVGTALPDTGIVAAYSRADQGSSGNGGIINLLATNGGVDLAALFTATAGASTPTSTSENGGNVFVDATGDINVRGISGAITLALAVPPIAIYTRSASTSNSSGNGGDITINSSGGSFTSNSNSQIGSFSSVNTTGNSGNGGNIRITAQNVSTGNLNSTSRTVTGDSGNGGNVAITATNGSVNTNPIGSWSSVSGIGNAGNAGDVQVRATNGGINNIAIFADSVSLVRGNSGNGGNITLDSTGDITLSGVMPPVLNPSYSSILSLTSAPYSVIGNSGRGGNISITAQNVNARDIFSSSRTTTGNSGNGGNISITAQNVSSSIIFADSNTTTGNSGNGGNIAVTATNGSLAANIIDSGSFVSNGGNTGNAGDIQVRATSGGINASAIAADTYNISGNSGNGGNITVDSTGDITLTGTLSPFVNTITSLTTASLSTTGNSGLGGNIRITGQNVNARDIYSNSHTTTGNSGNGGRIAVTATNGIINTDLINSGSSVGTGRAGNAGDVQLRATNGGINALAIVADAISNGISNGNGNSGNGGNVTLDSTGDINLTGASSPRIGPAHGAYGTSIISLTTNSYSVGGNTGRGGDISIAAQNVNARNIDSHSHVIGSGNNGNAGNIRISAPNGSVTTDLIDANMYADTNSNFVNSGSNFGGSAGNIDIEAQDVRTGIVTAYASTSNLSGVMSPSRGSGNGGNINITATRGNINSQNILSNSFSNFSSSGNGGNINLNALNGSINIFAIDAQSSVSSPINGGVGIGGNVNINAGNLFLASRQGFSPAANGTIYSIATQGGSGSGTVTITHGGSTSVPFLVGNATNNGTLGAISSGTGANTINNLVVPVPAAVNYYGTNITISTTAPTPPPSIPTPPPTPPDSPVPRTEPIDPNPPRTPDPVIVGTPPPILIPETIPLPSPISTPLTPPPTVVVTPPTIPILPPPSLPPSPPPASPTLAIDRPILDANPNVQSPVSLTAANSNIPIIDRLPVDFLGNSLRLLDQSFKEEFQAFTGIADEIATLDVGQAQNILNRITQETNVKPAFIYVFFSPLNEQTTTPAIPRTLSSSRVGILRNAQNTDTLEVVLVPPNGDLIRFKYPNLPRSEVIQIAGELTRGVARRSVYGSASKRMYDLIIAPLEEDLKRLKIDNLVFLMDAGLRSMPIAAMQSKDNKFIIEDYSVALMPSLTLTDTKYISLKDSQVMAMGADRFDNLVPLPGVPVELSAINQIRGGNIFLNENFTLSNLRQNRRPEQRIIHLATHGSFYGDKVNSFIQLWGTERLTLEQIRQSGFGTPTVDLLVLSACETALGNKDTELGFAGLAVTSGVRSALASLWQVSDAGTMGLMTEFYQQLQTTTTRSEALRQAQLAMLRGEVRLEGRRLVTPKENFALNEELIKLGDRQLNHPYFWSAFTMIGNPW